MTDAFSEMEGLALLLPNSQELLAELLEDKNGSKKLEFPMMCLLRFNKYRKSISTGRNENFRRQMHKLKKNRTKKFSFKEKSKKVQQAKKQLA